MERQKKANYSEHGIAQFVVAFSNNQIALPTFLSLISKSCISISFGSGTSPGCLFLLAIRRRLGFFFLLHNQSSNFRTKPYRNHYSSDLDAGLDFII